jgi:putative transposase
VRTDRSAAVDKWSARIPTLGHLPHRQPDPDIRRRRGAVYNLRRSRGAVYNLHAHLIFVTTYRRAVFTDAMLTLCEHPTRSVCADLDAELREFNGQTDHLHLLAHYPPSLACRCWSTGSKAYPLAGCASSTPPRSGNTCGARMSGPRPTSPPPAEGAPLTVIKRYIEQQQRPD